MKRATCHPERPYLAKGLCLSCYRKDYERRNADKIRQRKQAQYKRTANRVKQQSTARYKAKGPEILAQRRRRRALDPSISVREKLHRYGLTVEQFDAMCTSQKNKCAICNGDNGFVGAKPRALAVDHCHVTGVVRGLLCNSCNRAVGILESRDANIEQLAAYLAHVKTIRRVA